MARLGRGYPSKPFIKRQLATVNNITLVFSTISWIWNKNTYSLTFTNVPIKRAWVWAPQAPIDTLSLVYANKAWIWSKNTFSLASLAVLTQKTWVWTKSFTLQQFINQVSKSWQWQGNVVTSWPSGIIKRFLMLLGFGS